MILRKGVRITRMWSAGARPSTYPQHQVETITSRSDIIHAKYHLLIMTRGLLPQRMGTRYTEVVETCLTCLDKDSNGFGVEEEFQDGDGILVGVRYSEKASLRDFCFPPASLFYRRSFLRPLWFTTSFSSSIISFSSSTTSLSPPLPITWTG